MMLNHQLVVDIVDPFEKDAAEHRVHQVVVGIVHEVEDIGQVVEHILHQQQEVQGKVEVLHIKQRKTYNRIYQIMKKG